MSVQMPSGFIWGGVFYKNSGQGHEGKAREIIDEFKKRYPNEDWNWYSSHSSKDFLILKKKAIQVGSGNEPLCAIAAAKYYTKKEVNKQLEKFGLFEYKIYLIW